MILCFYAIVPIHIFMELSGAYTLIQYKQFACAKKRFTIQRVSIARLYLRLIKDVKKFYYYQFIAYPILTSYKVLLIYTSLWENPNLLNQ